MEKTSSLLVVPLERYLTGSFHHCQTGSGAVEKSFRRGESTLTKDLHADSKLISINEWRNKEEKEVGMKGTVALFTNSGLATQIVPRSDDLILTNDESNLTPTKKLVRVPNQTIIKIKQQKSNLRLNNFGFLPTLFQNRIW